MTRKPADFALWAALPMAHTSKIEGRIKMILDTTRRRASPRRFLLLAALTGAAAIVPLSMLQPTVNAQSVSQSAQSPANSRLIQLAGITDAGTPNGHEWSVNGKALPMPVFNNHWGHDTKITAKAGQKALFFVFHLPQSLQHVSVLYDISGTTRSGITLTRLGSTPGKKIVLLTETMQSIQMQNLSGTVVYGAAFPASLVQTDVRVGNFLGPWTVAVIVHYPFQGKYTIANPRGSRFPSNQLSLSGGKIMFGANMKTLNDFQNLRISAVDKQGHHSLLHLTLIESRGGREQFVEDLPQPLSRLKEIRVEARPIAWTEFKNVALQPAQMAALIPVITPAVWQTPWTSSDIHSAWNPSVPTYHLKLHIAPAVSGTRPDPPVTGKLASGPGQASHFAVSAWKPGKSNILTVKFDYTPSQTDKTAPDTIRLLTKTGAVAAIIRYNSA